MYKLKNSGDRIPPWLTPLETFNLGDNVEPHLTQACCSQYHVTINRTNIGDIPLSIIFLNSVQWFTLSKALEA